MQGERQELPVARIHARNAGQKIALAGAEARHKAARAGRIVGAGSVVLAKLLVGIALPAAFVALIGAGTARHPRPDFTFNIPKLPPVRFDDAAIQSLLRETAAPALSSMSLTTATAPSHEVVHLRHR